MNNKFFQKLEELSGKLSQEIHLRAIRDSFLSIIPLLVLGGFMTFFSYVLFVPTSFVGQMIPENVLTNITSITTRINNGTMGLISLFTLLLVSYNVAKSKKFSNPMYVTIVCTAMYFILVPFTSSVTIGETTEVIGGVLNSGMLASNNMFLALLVGIFGSEFFMKLANNEKLRINIQGQIPPAITESFNMMLTVFITLTVVALLSFGCRILTSLEVHELINKVLQAPLVGFAASPLGIAVNVFFQNLCFAFGIHPAGVTNPIFDTPLLAALEQGEIINLPFRDIYSTLGGSGATIALVIVILLFSKREDIRAVGKLGAPTSIFNINEPVLFGLPIVYNLVLAIPLCLVPVFNVLAAYFVTAAGWVSRISVYTAWSTPIGLSAYIGSGGDWRNVVLQFALILIDCVIYLFFLKIYEASLNKQDKELENKDN